MFGGEGEGEMFGEEELDPKRVFEELQMNTWKFTEKLFRTEGGKQEFMNWLFRLTDIEHTGEICLSGYYLFYFLFLFLFIYLFLFLFILFLIIHFIYLFFFFLFIFLQFL